MRQKQADERRPVFPDLIIPLPRAKADLSNAHFLSVNNSTPRVTRTCVEMKSEGEEHEDREKLSVSVSVHGTIIS